MSSSSSSSFSRSSSFPSIPPIIIEEISDNDRVIRLPLRDPTDLTGYKSMVPKIEYDSTGQTPPRMPQHYAYQYGALNFRIDRLRDPIVLRSQIEHSLDELECQWMYDPSTFRYECASYPYNDLLRFSITIWLDGDDRRRKARSDGSEERKSESYFVIDVHRTRGDSLTFSKLYQDLSYQIKKRCGCYVPSLPNGRTALEEMAMWNRADFLNDPDVLSEEEIKKSIDSLIRYLEADPVEGARCLPSMALIGPGQEIRQQLLLPIIDSLLTHPDKEVMLASNKAKSIIDPTYPFSNIDLFAGDS